MAPSAAQVPPQVEKMYQDLFWHVASYTVPVYTVMVWFGAIFAAIICCQAVYVWRKGAVETTSLKILVTLSVLSQVASAAFEISGNTQQIITAMRHEIGSVVLLPWTDSAVIACSVVAGLCSQFYFGRVAYRLFRNRAYERSYVRYIWVVIWFFLMAGVAAGGIASTVFFAQVSHKYFDKRIGIVGLIGLPLDLYLTWLACAAVLDIVLSITLCYKLLSERRADGYRSTNSLLIRLAVSTFETFTLTATMAIADFIMAILQSHVTYSKATRFEIVCYFFTVLIERAYSMSFLVAIGRHYDIRHHADGRGVKSTSDLEDGTSNNNNRRWWGRKGTSVRQGGNTSDLAANSSARGGAAANAQRPLPAAQRLQLRPNQVSSEKSYDGTNLDFTQMLHEKGGVVHTRPRGRHQISDQSSEELILGPSHNVLASRLRADELS